MNKAKVTFYMFLTIIGGIIFVGSQAWEWATFIKGDYGAVKTKGGNILQFLDSETSKRVSSNCNIPCPNLYFQGVKFLPICELAAS